ncbi:hypothetical protein Tco_1424385 [Tanacetum coccineum]
MDDCRKNIVSDALKNMMNPRQAVRGIQVGLKLGFKSTKQVYQPASKKNGASTSGKKKQVGMTRQEKRLGNLERQMLDEKLVLVDDDGKPINMVDSLVNADGDSEVDEVMKLQDISENLQAIRDDWDIKARGQKKN